MQPSDQENEQKRLNWLTEIYNRYVSELQRYIFTKVKEPFLAEDLTSTVFLKALRWLKDEQSQEQVRGWLYTTARTTIADYWEEREQFELHTLTGLEERFFPSTTKAGSSQPQIEQKVEKLLGLLSKREQHVLRLHYLQGYSAAEIAETLGTNAGHIRVLQLRALKRAAQLEKQARKVFHMEEQEFEEAIQLFTPESRRALDLSKEEALNLQHGLIGTEHLLWGLASEGSLNPFLTPLGITAERIHTGIVFIYERRTFADQLPEPLDPQVDASKALTPRTRQVILLASEEMKNQHEKRIRPAHLLIGLMNEGSGIGAGLLRSQGVVLLQARAALAPAETRQICSFCGRTGSQVKRIFPTEGPTPSAHICNECVERFHTMLV